MNCGRFFSCLHVDVIDDEGWDDTSFSKLTKSSRKMILDQLCSIFKEDSSFSNFNDNDIYELLQKIQERRLKPSQYVYRVGDKIEWFYFVVSGSVEIKELNITVGINKIVNSDEVISSNIRASSLRTKRGAHLFRIPKQEYMTMSINHVANPVSTVKIDEIIIESSYKANASNNEDNNNIELSTVKNGDYSSIPMDNNDIIDNDELINEINDQNIQISIDNINKYAEIERIRKEEEEDALEREKFEKELADEEDNDEEEKIKNNTNIKTNKIIDEEYILSLRSNRKEEDKKILIAKRFSLSPKQTKRKTSTLLVYDNIQQEDDLKSNANIITDKDSNEYKSNDNDNDKKEEMLLWEQKILNEMNQDNVQDDIKINSSSSINTDEDDYCNVEEINKIDDNNDDDNNYSNKELNKNDADDEYTNIKTSKKDAEVEEKRRKIEEDEDKAERKNFEKELAEEEHEIDIDALQRDIDDEEDEEEIEKLMPKVKAQPAVIWAEVMKNMDNSDKFNKLRNSLSEEKI